MHSACGTMACTATWSFGIEAVLTASKQIEGEENCVAAVEKSINVIEDDPTTGRYFVGRGCYPNSEGVVQLDAALMRGSDCAFGAVAALEGYAKPISVARRVLEHPSLSMLVGGGATNFARQQGFQMEDNHSLLTDETRRAYQQYKAGGSFPDCEGHDTLSVLCLDTHGSVCAGVSTSGPPFKPPGRVGDSPLPGCGLYADDQAGAAAASGDGEKILQFCPSFHIVQKMREGCTPQQACESTVSTMKERSREWFEVAVIALDIKGNTGAASTVKEWKDFRDGKVYPGFPHAVWRLGSQPEIKTQPFA